MDKLNRKRSWRGAYAEFEQYDFTNVTKHVRTADENILVLLTTKLTLYFYLKMMDLNVLDVYDINWTKIDNDVSRFLKVGHEYVTAIPKEIL
jgi:hypothetical protein